jgi:hypothetical protein
VSFTGGHLKATTDSRRIRPRVAGTVRRFRVFTRVGANRSRVYSGRGFRWWPTGPIDGLGFSAECSEGEEWLCSDLIRRKDSRSRASITEREHRFL